MMRLSRLRWHCGRRVYALIKDQAVLDQVVFDAKAAALRESQQCADQRSGVGVIAMADINHRHRRSVPVAGDGDAAAELFPKPGQRFAVDRCGHGIAGLRGGTVFHQATLQ